MARIRTIKPETWTDSRFVALSPFARLLFIGSWNYADDHGCVKDDAVQLKLRVLPTDAVDAEAVVQELLDAGLLRPMRNPAGETFWLVSGFEKHQRIDKRTKPTYGDRDTWTPAESRGIPTTSAESPRLPPTSAESPPTHATEGRKEGSKGKGGEGRKDLALASETPTNRRRRLPDPFEITPTMRAWATEKVPLIDVDRETEQFCDYHRAKGSSQLDWPATWRTWMRNAVRFQSYRKPAQTDTDDYFARALERAAEQDARDSA